MIPLCASLLGVYMYRLGYGVAFTNRPLRMSERFEVEIVSIQGYPWLSLGITTWRLVTLLYTHVVAYEHVH